MTISEVRHLLSIVRSAGPVVARRWAMMQMACIGLVWVTLAGLVVLILSQKLGWIDPITGLSRHLLLGMIGASVGFLTNYIAIQMLFQPEHPRQAHWIRFLTLGLWRQGLVPKRRQELALRIGEMVERELLTPRKMVDEIARVIDNLLSDDAFREGLRRDLEPFVRRTLPQVVERMTPEVMGMLAEAWSESLDAQMLADFLQRTVEPELTEHREPIAAFIVQLLQQRAPEIRAFAQRQIEKRGFWARLATGLLETINVLEWDKVERSIAEELGSAATREQVKAMLVRVARSLGGELRQSEAFGQVVERMKPRLRSEGRRLVSAFLARKLPQAIERMMDSDALWEWLAQDGVNLFRREVLDWLERYGVERIAPRFEIGRRVEEAVNELDISQLNEQVNKVAADQLGGIQVLGFVLGGLLGLLVPLALG